VLRVFDGAADVTITGSLSALRSLADGNDALYKGEVKVEGELGVAQQIRDIVAHLDVDLEEFLAPFFGGTLARRANIAGRDLVGWLERTRERFHENVEDYLKEESELVPTDEEVSRWSADVDELREVADRLEARVRRLEREGRAS